MKYQDDEFSPNNNPGPRLGLGPFVDPQQRAQLVMAIRAAQQDVQGTSAAPGNAFSSRPGGANSQAAQQGAIAYRYNPETGQIEGAHKGGPGAQAQERQRQQEAKQRRAKQQAQPEPQLATAEDKAAGNYIEVGFRRTQDWKTGHLFNHSYIWNPEMNSDARLTTRYYEVLGDEGGPKNQQVRDSTADNRHVEGTAKSLLAVSPAQKEAVTQRLQDFSPNPGRT